MRPVRLPRWLHRRRVEWWAGAAIFFGALWFADAVTDNWYWFAAVVMFIGVPLVEAVNRGIPKMFSWDEEREPFKNIPKAR